MFYVPTEGRHAGLIVPFATGPMRCEMTGPSFVGNTLVISCSIPGEDNPTRTALDAKREDWEADEDRDDD